MKSLAEKLQTHNEQTAYSPYTIAHFTKERGDQVSPTYWYGLIAGKKLNPTRRRIAALADLFKVPWRYLADDTIASPADAVIAEAETLSTDELKQVILVLQERVNNGEGNQTRSR